MSLVHVYSKHAHRTHTDIMNDFLATSASDEAYRPNSHASQRYHPNHSRSRSAHSQPSQHSSAEDMVAQASMPTQDPSAMGLQPPDFSQAQHSRSNNPYQDTQMAQPSFGSSSNTLSPSISSYHEHATPETLLSDHVYTDISQYTTPGFEDDLLDAQMNMNFLTVDAVNTFNTNFSNPSVVSHNSSGPSSVNISNNDLLAPNFPATYGGSSHLISPSLTTHSSPGSSSECLAKPSLVPAPLQNSGAAPGSSTAGFKAEHNYGMPIPEQQRSPALTGSPGDGYLDISHDRPTNFTSPVVRIENYSRDESPARTNHTKRSLGNKRSGNHLSPHDAEESSEDETGQSFEVPIRTVQVAPPVRGDDGSWIRNTTSGHAGVSPEERKTMQDSHLPTLKEQEDQRLMEEKNHEVSQWLTTSEVGSEAGEPETRPRRKKPSTSGRRRARSTNDIMFHRQRGLGVQLPAFEVPGPGLNINVESDEEGSEVSDSDDNETRTPDSPPAPIEIGQAREEGSYFPQMPPPMEDESIPPHVRPWHDTPRTIEPASEKYQPDTSNAAMMKFHQRARDLETASLAATLGSHRRRSESEIGSVLHASGISKHLGPEVDAAKVKEKTRSRKGSLLENLRRNPSNLLKRKGSHSSHPSQQLTVAPTPPTLSLETKINVPPKRSGSWGRPKSPKVEGSPTALFKEHGSLAPGTNPFTYAKNAIRRSRSRSDIGSKTPGLSELMRSYGGPPTLSLVTPANEADAMDPSTRGADGSGDEEDADFDDVAQDSVTMDLKVRTDPIIPTVEGFRAHARLLNPRVDEYMVERIAQEQNRRFKKLLDLKIKHLKAIESRNCASHEYCIALGGESKILPPRSMNNKDGEAAFGGFQIVVSSEDEIDPSEEGSIIPKPLPAGFPVPPLKRMPAEFECPLCFKVKKFYKPSDWTKHVYEDLQPFTCTFPNCGEPMSFKRKADWVRHENERHRQPEKWHCKREGCGHICYRKNNFVQHLVREHKVPDPKARTGRATQAANKVQVDLRAWRAGQDIFEGPGDKSDQVWALVGACKQDTTREPKNEPCRFCGNICPSWKKLTVHLAKHLEQISLPILGLVETKQLSADSIVSPIEKPRSHRARAASSAAPPGSNSSSKYTQNLSVNSSYSSYSQSTSTSATPMVMHTYPPPQFPNYQPQAQQQPQAAKYSGGATSGFGMRSYPGMAATNGAQKQNRLDPNQYASTAYTPSITPVTDYAQSGQVFHSPIEAGPFSNDLPPDLYAYNEPMGAEYAGGGMSGGQFGAGQYQQMAPSYPRQQQGYPYQG